ncbi:hypothetical protein EON67_04600, partial [archaeon]
MVFPVKYVVHAQYARSTACRIVRSYSALLGWWWLQVWGGETPTDLVRLSRSWWLSYFQYLVYAIANWSSEAVYTQLLRTWHQAHCIVSGKLSTRAERVMTLGLVVVGGWETFLFILYGFLPFHTVLVLNTVGCILSYSTIGFAFGAYWWYLWNAMKLTA